MAALPHIPVVTISKLCDYQGSPHKLRKLGLTGEESMIGHDQYKQQNPAFAGSQAPCRIDE
jgi:hypothetical protein